MQQCIPGESEEGTGEIHEEETCVFPASFAQQRLWFIDRLEPGSPAYNIFGGWTLNGPLDVAALEHSLSEIVRRHEALRTTFDMIDGQPAQLIAPARPVALRLVDVETEEACRRLARDEARAPFDLAAGPLLRATLLRLGPERHILLITVHHIVTDAWSMRVFYRELNILYRACRTGQPSPLPDLPIQYADYAVWQREWLQGDALEAQLSYWRRQLDEAPVLALPQDHRRPETLSRRGASHAFTLPPDTAARLRALARSERTTLFMVLLAAYKALLYRYTGQDDIAVGSPIAGRDRSEIEGVIGFFVNTLVLRTQFSGKLSFRDLLARVREVTLGAFAHQDLPFEKLVEELRPERVLGQTPLFQTTFQIHHTSEDRLELEGVETARFRASTGSGKFDLSLTVMEGPDGLRGAFGYCPDLFEAATIERMATHFCRLAAAAAANPDAAIGLLPILGESERAETLARGEPAPTDYPRDLCIHQIFESQAARRPDADALIFGGASLTYQTLNSRANQLARLLRRRGVGPDTPVAVCMERSPDLVVSLLAILKVGGAYLPLDPGYPSERLRFMLEDTEAVLLLARRETGELPPGAPVLYLDQEATALDRESPENLRSMTTPEHLAYILYTSGSTGQPKGVAVPHRAVARLLFGVDYADFGEQETFLQLAPVSFDASTFELWGALLHGGRCVLYPGEIPDLELLRDLIREYRVTTLWLTRSLFNLVIDEAPDALRGVRQLLTGGEALSVPHVRRALALLPGVRLVNGYGPTESTTFTTCFQVPRTLPEDAQAVPIGVPIGNTQVYVLDAHLNPVPEGCTGELYIGGDGLARGYLNRPDLTAERFIPNPFRPDRRLYRTGDIVRRLPDGNLTFIERRDGQVKIRGFRIETGEVEAALKAIPSVQEAAVLVQENVTGKRLIACIVPHGGSNPAPGELRALLSARLPAYMVPAAFILLDRLPLTPNGKLDRRALPVAGVAAGPTPDAAPRTPEERTLLERCAALLGFASLGVHDNLFDAGMNSLQVVHLSVEANRAGLPLTPRDFFENQTIAALAAAARDAAAKREQERLATNGSASLLRPAPSEGSSIVAIRSGSSKPPFFCFGVFLFRKLAPYLDPDRPFYGLLRQSLTPERLSTQSVEEMAAGYVAEIRAVQPSGPYHLGGFCFGGIVAYEMARQFHALGESVALLALIDASRPRRVRIRQTPMTLEEKARRHSRNILLQGPRYLLAWARQRAAYESGRAERSVKKWMGRLHLLAGRSLPESLEGAFTMEADAAALRKYVLHPYPGALTLFRGEPAPDLLGRRTRPEAGAGIWDELAGEVNIVEAPGRHGKMFEEPHVRVLAARLNACLDAADPAAPSNT